MKQQITFIQHVSKAIMNPPKINIMGQVVSLLNVLGGASRKKVMSQHSNFQPIAVPIPQDMPPIENVKGIGKKIGAKLRTFGISTIDDLKLIDIKKCKLPGISAIRIQKWQMSL
ncbi:MAG TPA: helix-hairpin-helix domain-containing protein [Candidatus Deferrimicrobium sp.]|nr:helix-hairpin-helix domain-containing protein [Candidatus Deferrimicrobium sp.]